MKTKLSLSALLFVGFVIAITVIQSAAAEDPRVKRGGSALGRLTRTLFKERR